MAFAVVEFTEDYSVDVVPCNWLTDNKTSCFWPPFRTNLLISAVKKSVEPQPSWMKCTVRVLNIYESYSIARLKLKKAEDTSALDTEIEGDNERQRKKRKLSFDVEPASPSEEERTQASLMPMPDVPGSLQHSSGMFLTTVPDGSLSLETSKTNRSETSAMGISPSGEVLDRGALTTSSNRKRMEKPNIRSSPSGAALDRGALTMSSKIRRTEMSIIGSSPSGAALDQGVSSKGTERGLPSKEVQVILSKLALIEAQQLHQGQLLQQILNSAHISDESCDLPDGVSLPVQNMNEMMDLDKLMENVNNAKQLTRYLGAIGGKDVAETTRRIMTSIMTNSVAQRMNFAGRGRKIGIGDLNVLKVIVGAVRRNRLLRNPSRAEVELTVKMWLRGSSDRSGGRHARDNRRPAQRRKDLESESDSLVD